MGPTWYLLFSIYGCQGGGIDPGIVPGACVYHDQRVVMPSLETCRQVRDVNQGSRCMAEQFDPTPPDKRPGITYEQR